MSSGSSASLTAVEWLAGESSLVIRSSMSRYQPRIWRSSRREAWERRLAGREDSRAAVRAAGAEVGGAVLERRVAPARDVRKHARALAPLQARHLVLEQTGQPVKQQVGVYPALDTEDRRACRVVLADRSSRLDSGIDPRITSHVPSQFLSALPKP